MRLHLFPIEPFEHRYTKQWYEWFRDEMPKFFNSVSVYDGDQLGGIRKPIEHGEFLDAFNTHYWKSTQLAAFIETAEHLDENDVVLLLDGWSPQVTALAYIRDVAKKPFKIVSLMHAGTYDPWDHLSSCGCDKWALDIEKGWFKAVDAVCVATYFHKNLILGQHFYEGLQDKIHVTGFPLNPDWMDHFTAWDAREQLVVFPHRHAPEKGLEAWAELKRIYREKYGNAAVFVDTVDQCKSKAGYYQLLGRARVVVSTARQETWGIAMQEAMSLGCHPVAPDRLSYMELIPEQWRYGAWDDDDDSDALEVAADLIHLGLSQKFPFAYDMTRWGDAIENIAEVCHGLQETSAVDR